jgi:hypothetical protein
LHGATQRNACSPQKIARKIRKTAVCSFRLLSSCRLSLDDVFDERRNERFFASKLSHIPNKYTITMRITAVALALVATATTTSSFSVAPSATSFVAARTVTRAPAALFLQPQHSEEDESSLESPIADESTSFDAMDASKIAMNAGLAWVVTTQMASAAGPDWGT